MLLILTPHVWRLSPYELFPVGVNRGWFFSSNYLNLSNRRAFLVIFAPASLFSLLFCLPQLGCVGTNIWHQPNNFKAFHQVPPVAIEQNGTDVPPSFPKSPENAQFPQNCQYALGVYGLIVLFWVHFGYLDRCVRIF